MLADVDTHLAWLRRFALQRAMAVLPLGRPSAVTIRVERGLMAGASTRIQGESLEIGAGPDCDVQLLDAGVGDRHATLRMHDSIFGMLVEVTAHDPVRLAREPLARDPLTGGATSGLVRLPLALSLGGATVTIAPPRRSGITRHVHQADLATGAVVLIIGLALVLFVNQLVLAGQIETVETGMQAIPAPASAVRADALALAQLHLAERGLASDITLAKGESGSIAVSGKVPAARWTDWQAYLAWYDREAGLPTLVSSVTMTPKLAQLRPIQAVQLHAPATVFFATGEPAQIGAVLEEGWTLTAIDADGLTLERGTESTRIQF
jgi:hypothetical protein